MTTDLDSVKREMMKMYSSTYGMSTEEAEKAYEVFVHEHGDRINYCVSYPDCKLMALLDDTRIKSPAHYFKNFNHARIHQLKGMLDINIHSDSAIKEMQSELKMMEETYPEYVL